MLNRRSVLKAGAATLSAISPATVAAATSTAPAADPVLDLVRQLAHAQDAARRLGRKADDIMEALSAECLNWTPAELIEHRIPGDASSPRRVRPDEIEKADAADRPRDTRSTRTESTVQTDEGELWSTTISLLTIQVPDAEFSAWKGRCAARQALQKAKHDAWTALRGERGYTDASRLVDEAWGEYGRIFSLIVDTPARTVPGVLAKLKVFMEEGDLIDATVPPDQLCANDRLFLSALEALERIGGAA